MNLSGVLLAVGIAFYSWSAPEAKRLVIIGDSLTEGYGVTREEAYPAMLQGKIKADGKNWEVINSGLSGSTSASAVGRVNWHLKTKPDLILIALGANDGLRGLSVESLSKNLANAIQACQKAKVKVILIGMTMPPNYGADYVRRFKKVFPDLAKKYSVPLIPFLLDKVGGERQLNQSDGIHPNAKGHRVMADQLYPQILRFL